MDGDSPDAEAVDVEPARGLDAEARGDLDLGAEHRFATRVTGIPSAGPERGALVADARQRAAHDAVRDSLASSEFVEHEGRIRAPRTLVYRTLVHP